jgi:hypothetical protein
LQARWLAAAAVQAQERQALEDRVAAVMERLPVAWEQ